MDAIRWKGNALSLLDQTRLPVEEVWLDYTDYRPVAVAIRTMVVRGAPAIGVTAAYAYCLAALAGEDLDQARTVLAASRPTAVNLFPGPHGQPGGGLRRRPGGPYRRGGGYPPGGRGNV